MAMATIIVPPLLLLVMIIIMLIAITMIMSRPVGCCPAAASIYATVSLLAARGSPRCCPRGRFPWLLV